MTIRPSIRVQNAQRKFSADVADLANFSMRAFRRVLALRARPGNVLETLTDITIVLVSDRRIAALHRQFMNVPGPTDVITFQEGDIFVSVETAQRHAERFGCSLQEELRLYALHGLLHLRGFDDRTAEQARVMEAAQRRIISTLTTG